ncbi:putative beta-D-galactosidase [Paenibacillus terrae HPL-003]|uniref:Putative beta-D-galactosidase n=1 Tax=Paenibacillus terrae (strain HPL-003) TaxID=985665 RepID=G7VXY3_PAETH|nr:YhcH/YjgK/YiaL family protein [Paenibacillus terrae]AET57161.1 putative beta-D-galactosidase [Paenibacillus terrae HPL-003]
MICDELKEMSNYDVLGNYSEKMMELIEKIDLENFKTGKVLIDGMNFFALLTEYDTKPWEETDIETHDKYYDVVIVLEGRENIYVDFRDSFTVKKAYSEEKDITFYQLKKEKIRVTMEPGMFILFLPNDIHHPYCDCEAKSHIKKVTFKIKIS